MELIYDGPFGYSGSHNTPSHCWVRVFETKDKSIVIVSEMVNTHTTVHDVIETIVTDIANTHKISHEKLMCIEHYPVGTGKADKSDIFRLVTFNLKNNCYINPQWQSTNNEEIEKIIGEKLSD